jgi:hypothetical protein
MLRQESFFFFFAPDLSISLSLSLSLPAAAAAMTFSFSCIIGAARDRLNYISARIDFWPM